MNICLVLSALLAVGFAYPPESGYQHSESSYTQCVNGVCQTKICVNGQCSTGEDGSSGSGSNQHGFNSNRFNNGGSNSEGGNVSGGQKREIFNNGFSGQRRNQINDGTLAPEDSFNPFGQQGGSASRFGGSSNNFGQSVYQDQGSQGAQAYLCLGSFCVPISSGDVQGSSNGGGRQSFDADSEFI